MREMKAECLIVRRSFLEFMKLGSCVLEVVGGLEEGEGREMRPEPDFEVEVAFERMEGRFLGAVGAWSFVSFVIS